MYEIANCLPPSECYLNTAVSASFYVSI